MKIMSDNVYYVNFVPGTAKPTFLGGTVDASYSGV